MIVLQGKEEKKRDEKDVVQTERLVQNETKKKKKKTRTESGANIPHVPVQDNKKQMSSDESVGFFSW
jgi:hypothetical protein